MKTQTANTHHIETIIRIADITLASLILMACFPLLLLSSIRSLILGKKISTKYRTVDYLNRPLTLTKLNSDPASTLGSLIDILRGEISFCGVEILNETTKPVEHNNPTLKNKTKNIKAGIFSVTLLHKSSGLAAFNQQNILINYIENLSLKQHLLTTTKCFIVTTLFNKTNLNSPKQFSLFGIRIDNTTMKDAVNWATGPKKETTQIGFFVNVNSVNLCIENPKLRTTINAAEQVFADGSGVRIGAKHQGVALRDNVNGTDLLPKLCKAAKRKSLSIYLLGAAPGVAQLAAEKLQKQYPGLKIAGTHHGFFNKEGKETQNIIEKINQSNADILLTGFGSPLQETWLIENKEQLNVTTAMAVGGLFDFFSDSIARAPQWMRELGLEWVWRLLQDPATKWRRYIIGNPMFLLRLWFTQNIPQK